MRPLLGVVLWLLVLDDVSAVLLYKSGRFRKVMLETAHQDGAPEWPSGQNS